MNRIKTALKKENPFRKSLKLDNETTSSRQSKDVGERGSSPIRFGDLLSDTLNVEHDLIAQPSSEQKSILSYIPRETTENVLQWDQSVSPYTPFDSDPYPYSTGNAYIPDEDLVGDTLSEEHDIAAQPSSEQKSILSGSKRRRRRESHNIVERRRRDAINRSIRDLFNLLPSHRRKGESKLDILEAAVNWTRDLTWAHHLKLKREADTENIIEGQKGPMSWADLPPSMPGELAIDREVQSSLTGNNITSFSSSDHNTYHTRRASEPIPEYTVDDATTHMYRPQRHLRKVTSRGSIISYVASVHSVTSLTYRSPAGDVRTETYGHKSTVSYFPEEKHLIVNKSDGDIPRQTDEAVFQNASKHGDNLGLSSSFPETKSVDTASSKIGRNIPTSESELAPNLALTYDKSPILIKLGESAEKPLQQSRSQSLREGPHLRSKHADSVESEPTGPSDRRVSHSQDTSVLNLHLDHSDRPEDASDVAPRLETGKKQAKASFNQDQAIKEGSSVPLDNSNLEKVDGGMRPDNDRSIRRAGYSVTYLENGLVRLRWKCVCKHSFQINVLEHQKDAAIMTIKSLAHDASDIERHVTIQYPLLSFMKLREKLSILFYSSRNHGKSLPQMNITSTRADDVIRAPREALNYEPDRYICVCFPGITYKKYLHHVDVNKAADDPQLFSALQKTYYDWKPLWRRVLTLRSLARVEYFEFKVFHSNLVTIKDDWRDRFPWGHGPNEWSYIPTSRDMTPYLIDDVLTHYVHNPECVKPGKYFWTRIPKKLFCHLECPNDKPFKVGWGLYFIEDFSQLYLMLILLPVLVGGVAVAGWYCAHYGKSFADGATVASGFAALVMYMFSVAQGWAKQKNKL